MVIKRNKLVTLVLLAVISYLDCVQLQDYCPKADLLKPCECNVGFISCMDSNITSNGLVDIFANLSKVLAKDQKHFKRFHLSEELIINELKDNTFKDITFTEIEIMFNKNLTKVSKDSFNGTNLVSDVITFAYNYGLKDLSVYETLSKFTNASRIYLYDNGITTIPTNALKKLDKLNTLLIGGKNVIKIEERAFENLNALMSVNIFNTSISYIPEKAFHFAKHADDKKNRVYLGFPDNILLTGDSFADNCFSQTDKSVELGLNTLQFDRKMGKITYLKEQVFLSYFNHNPHNTLVVVGLPIDCSDCKNYWLTKQPKVIQKRIAALACSNAKNLTDSNNFKNCSKQFSQ